jgi:hypothetical protein
MGLVSPMGFMADQAVMTPLALNVNPVQILRIPDKPTVGAE